MSSVPMNELLTTYGAWIAFVAGTCGVIYTFLNRDRYKAQIDDIYKPGNDELRKQLASARDEISTVTRDNTIKDANVHSLSTLVSELKELNSRQPDFTTLATVMSGNHKEMMLKLTELGKVIANRQ